ncbi:MAG: tripartite tricarboxylate transporter substrate binding protein [Alcaligenaceae bacterium]
MEERILRLLRLASLGLCGMLALLTPSMAHAYPERTIRLVVPNAAGGGTDAFARVMAQKLGEVLQQTVVVENKPGAQGGIGTTYGAKAAPDGYTLTIGFVSTLAVNPFVYSDIGYEPLKDFVAVAVGVNQPYLLVTYPDAPYQNLKAFAQFAKEKKGGATFASTSSQTELIGVLFQNLLDTKMLYIPYKNATTAVVELSRGDIDVMVASLPSAIPLLAAGKLRALAVTGHKRVAALPNVPSAAEAGYPDFEANGWYGIVAPKGTPDAIVQLLNQQINKILAMPEVQQNLTAAGFEIQTGTAAEFAALIERDYHRWGAVAQTQKSMRK